MTRITNRWPSPSWARPRPARPRPPSLSPRRCRSRSSRSTRPWSTAAWTSAPPSRPRRTGERAASPHRHHRPARVLLRHAVPRRRDPAGGRDPGARPAAAAGRRHDDVLQRAQRRPRRPADRRRRRARRSTRKPRASAGPACTRSCATRPGHGRPPGAERRPAHQPRAGDHRTVGQADVGELLARREKTELPFELVSFALEPSDRAVLHERIALRFDQMLGKRDDTGIVAEVAGLRARGDLHLGLPSMRCVGYRQAGNTSTARSTAPSCAKRHHRHAPAGQAPADLAAGDAGADRDRLPGAKDATRHAFLPRCWTSVRGEDPRNLDSPGANGIMPPVLVI
jgi:hypothetical protein